MNDVSTMLVEAASRAFKLSVSTKYTKLHKWPGLFLSLQL